MASLFKLVGSVFIDTDKANESLAKTGDKAENLGGKFKKNIATAGKWAAGITAGAVAVAGAMYKATEKAAETMDTIDKGSKRMGISAESYQELAYATGQCGIEMSTLEKAAKKLEGTDLSLDDALESIMQLGTEEERTKKATELFGKGVAYNLGPLLKESGDNFDELKQKANDLGLVFSEDAVSAGVTLGDTMSDVKQSLGSIGTTIAVELMPYVQKALDWVVEHMPEIQVTVKSVIGAIGSIIKALWPVIKPVLNTIGKAFQFIVDLIGRIADGLKDFKMPKIKLPHFAIKPEGWKIGDLLKGSIPKLSVEWYAKAMDNPMALDGATIFGSADGKLLGGGETGTEYISGKRGIQEALAEVLAGMNLQVVMDSGALVGSIAPRMDRALGNIYERRAR